MKIGDAVQLNSGGPNMLIFEECKVDDTRYFNCSWVEDGVSKTHIFKENMLKITPSEAVRFVVKIDTLKQHGVTSFPFDVLRKVKNILTDEVMIRHGIKSFSIERIYQ